MQYIINKFVEYLDCDKVIWNDLERMEMKLGLQVLIHNVIMIGTILSVAKIINIFGEAFILMTAYGILKMTCGGIHLKKSLSCLLATGAFVILGTWVTKYMSMNLKYISTIYLICLILIVAIGPQGTKNNPISSENYKKFKKRAAVIVMGYLGITIYMDIFWGYIPYLLCVAVVFETISLFPLYLKNRRYSCF